MSRVEFAQKQGEAKDQRRPHLEMHENQKEEASANVSGADVC